MKYFGTDGIRGRANVEPLTAQFITKLALAIGKIFSSRSKHPQIVIGKDTRLSCYIFEAALVSGICSQGADAILVGSIPTPAIAFITRSLRADAGVVISASHNPYYDNGIKFFDSLGYKLSNNLEEDIEELIDSNSFPLKLEPLGKALRVETAVGRYVEFVKNSFDKSLDLRGLKIAIDCANGAAYKVAPLAFQELGATVTVINAAPNGTNINDNCGSTAIDIIRQKVLEVQADVGISFDGDGDRVIMCDSMGNIIDGDLIMGVCALDMKSRGALNNNTVVATVMSNIGFENTLNTAGIKVERTAVGDKAVMEQMKIGGYNLGGEQSGHIIFTDYTTTGDGLISALQFLKIMVKRGKTAHELCATIQKYPQVLKNTIVSNRIPIANLPKTSKLISDIAKTLGNSGRVLVRYSGTENKLRIMVEGKEEERLIKYANSISSCVEEEIR
jgi:phosphoglucosamine mutase